MGAMPGNTCSCLRKESNRGWPLASCQWSINTRYGTEDVEIYGIGKCNIKDFKPVSSEKRTHNPAYAAPYADALQKTMKSSISLMCSYFSNMVTIYSVL